MDRIWYNEELINKVVHNFLGKYPTYDKSKFLDIAKNSSLDEFRELCSILYKSSYISSYFDKISLDEKRELINACNDRINDQIGLEALTIYEFFRKSQNHSFWTGDNRYKLFSYDFADYEDRQIIKSVVTFLIKYEKHYVELKDLKNLSYLYNTGLSYNLYNENKVRQYAINWDTDDKDFNKINEARTIHINAWIEFTNYIWNKEFEKAYKLILFNLKDTGIEGIDYI